MAKKKEGFICDKCKYYTDKCEHPSNLLILVHKRIETLTYKTLDKKSECEFYLSKD